MIVFLTGAGISAESGIQTFRDSDGLWNEYDVREVCDIETFEQNKDKVFKFYNERRLEYANARPNLAHQRIAQLQQEKGVDAVKIITQNVDHLFEKAGCCDVVHLHGHMSEMICLNCGNIHQLDVLEVSSKTECTECKQVRLKPNVVFFNEAANYHPMLEILETMTNQDALVVIGTSGMAIPLNAMVEAVSGYKILNNLDASDEVNEALFDEVIYSNVTDSIEEVISLVISHININ
jgi:NAD-dependent deacetylase